MKTAIFYDFETTGLPLFDQPSDDPRQPHIVQLAAMMVDLDSKKAIQSIDVIVRPDGWEIPQEVVDVRGITTEHAADVGVSERVVTSMLLDMIGSRLRVAHNESFDARIMRIALKRHFNDEVADQWKAGESECTMKLDKVARSLGKNPKLIEAYEHYFGKPLEGAHNAMVDTLACRDVYFAMKQAE